MKNLAEHVMIDAEGNETQEHLYVKTLFLASTDSIDNYIEIDKPV